MEREARHAWFHEASQGFARSRRARNSSHRSAVRRFGNSSQGLRSFHSLNPWLPS